MAAVCDCGNVIPPQKGPGRPRKKCEDCRPSNPARRTEDERAQERARVVPLAVVPAPQVSEVPRAAGAPVLGSLVVAVYNTLAAVGRQESAEGMAALYAAQALDTGDHTASGAAALLKEMRSCLTAATAGAEPAEDLVDQLRSRRGRSSGSA